MLGHHPKEEGKIKYKFLIYTQLDLENTFVCIILQCVYAQARVCVCMKLKLREVVIF